MPAEVRINMNFLECRFWPAVAIRLNSASWSAGRPGELIKTSLNSSQVPLVNPVEDDGIKPYPWGEIVNEYGKVQIIGENRQ